MKAYAIVITIAFWSQFLLVMIYADKIRKKRKKDEGDLSSAVFATPVFAKVEIPMEELIADGRAEEKIGAELILKLRERGCIRAYQVRNERDYTLTISCVVLAKPLNLN